MLTITGTQLVGAGMAGKIANWYVPNPRGGRRVGGVSDGTSNTIAIVEDVGRGYFGVVLGAYGQPNSTNLTLIARWAEPDQANGVSGPPVGTDGSTPCYESNGGKSPSCNGRMPINNNATPVGGPSDCPWSVNNCGPNDEAFSFHPGGAMAVFGDGHVAFIRDSISMTQMRALCTPDGSDSIPDDF